MIAAGQTDPATTAPWPFLTQKVAAKRLGVDKEFLEGLANNPIRAFKCRTRRGGFILLFNREDIEQLANKVRR